MGGRADDPWTPTWWAWSANRSTTCIFSYDSVFGIDGEIGPGESWDLFSVLKLQSGEAAIGLSLVGVSAFSMALGHNLQRFSFRRQRRKHFSSAYCCQWIWWIGLCCWLLGFTLNFLGELYVPLSVASPMHLFYLLCNSLFAHLINGEVSGWAAVAKLLLCISGLLLAIFTGVRSPTSIWDAKVIGHRITQDSMRTPGWILVGSTIVTLLLIHPADIRGDARALMYHAVPSAVPAHSRVSPSGKPIQSRVRIDSSLPSAGEGQFSMLLLRLMYPLCAGLCSSWTLLASYAIEELTKNVVREDTSSALDDHQSVYVLLTAPAALLLQIHFSARSLDFFEAQYVVPTIYTVALSVALLGRTLFLQDAECFDATRAGCFYGGIAIAWCSLIFLFLGRRLPTTVHPVELDDEIEIELPQAAVSEAAPEELVAKDHVEVQEEMGEAEVAPSPAEAAGAKVRAAAVVPSPVEEADSEVDQLLRLADRDGDGALNEKEFATYLLLRKKPRDTWHAAAAPDQLTEKEQLCADAERPAEGDAFESEQHPSYEMLAALVHAQGAHVAQLQLELQQAQLYVNYVHAAASSRGLGCAAPLLPLDAPVAFALGSGSPLLEPGQVVSVQAQPHLPVLNPESSGSAMMEEVHPAHPAKPSDCSLTYNSSDSALHSHSVSFQPPRVELSRVQPPSLPPVAPRALQKPL